MSKVKTISLPKQKINLDTDIIIDREDIIYYDTKKHLNLIKFKKNKSSSIPMKSKIDSKSLSNRKLSGTTSQSSSNRMSPIKEYSGTTSQSSSNRMSPIKEYSGTTSQSSSNRMSLIKDSKKKSDKSSSKMSHIKGYSGKTLESSSSIISAVKDTKKKSDKS